MSRVALNLVLVACLLLSQAAQAARCQVDHSHGHGARPHVHLTSSAASHAHPPHGHRHHCHGHHHHVSDPDDGGSPCEANPTTAEHHDADAVYLNSAPAVRGERAEAFARATVTLAVVLADAAPLGELFLRTTAVRMPALDPPPGPPLYVRHLALLI